MKRWTQGAAVAATLLALTGCVAGLRLTSVETRVAYSNRPHGSYYCYDCHGYRFFDPYYDWCAYYGFRYSWANHPEAVDLYRERYPRIKDSHPEYGRYRYRPDYRDTRRYREPRDYEAWRVGQGPAGERTKVREQRPRDAGRDQKQMKRRERREPRDGRPSESSREGV